MKNYGIYIYKGETAYLRDESNNIDEACDKAHELERNSKEEFEGTIIYNAIYKEWFGKHKRGTAYILSK